MTDDEWRVEVELDDPEHGYTLGERMRSLNLDGVLRRHLGRRVIVSRDGPHLFAYTDDETRAREAADVVRELLDDEELSGTLTVTRWHPIEEAWKDAELPLPRTPAEQEAEHARREAAEAQEAEAEGELDWLVRVSSPDRGEAVELERTLTAEGVPVTRRWSYLLAGALTEEDADALADRIRSRAAGDTEVSVEVNPSDLPTPLFVFVGAMLDRGRPADR